MSVYDTLEFSQMPYILESAINHPSDYIRKQAVRLLSEDEETLNRQRAVLAEYYSNLR